MQSFDYVWHKALIDPKRYLRLWKKIQLDKNKPPANFRVIVEIFSIPFWSNQAEEMQCNSQKNSSIKKIPFCYGLKILYWFLNLRESAGKLSGRVGKFDCKRHVEKVLHVCYMSCLRLQLNVPDSSDNFTCNVEWWAPCGYMSNACGLHDICLRCIVKFSCIDRQNFANFSCLFTWRLREFFTGFTSSFNCIIYIFCTGTQTKSPAACS